MASLVARLLGAPQQRSGTWYPQTLGDLDAWMDRAGGLGAASGRTVGPDNALLSVPVYACVKVLAETIASLPLLVYRRLDDGGKRRAPEHPLYDLLHDRPNPEMTAYELREALVGHLCLWGNAYCEIERAPGLVKALWPLRPDRMTPIRDGGNRLAYEYRLPDGQKKLFPFESIMHWRGLSSNGIVGYSPITLAREAVGLSLATEEFGARWFGNGSRPSGVLQHPGKLSKEAHGQLKESWEDDHRGLSNAQRVAILEEGMTWQSIGVPPEDAQFLQTRSYQLRDIARIYRVPLHLVGDLERATFSNIEHQSLEFVKYTLVPWLVRIEQAIKRDLFGISDGKRSYYAEHLVDGLLRGDIKSRYEAYAVARQNGWMNANEIRELENANRVPGGDVYLVNSAMVPLDAAGKPQQPEPAPRPTAPAQGPEQQQEGGDDNGRQ